MLREKQKETNVLFGNQTGEKRMRSESSRTEEEQKEERPSKRQELPLSPAGGISIKGMAAARGIRSSTTPSRTVVRSAQPEDIRSRLQPQASPKLNILSRLSQPVSRPLSETLSPKSELTQTISSPVPISTSGKSNTVVIKGFDDSVQYRDIVSMAKSMPGGYRDITFDSELKQAIIKFSTVETAVTFRRKYNR